jgi:hypothetical protein
MWHCNLFSLLYVPRHTYVHMIQDQQTKLLQLDAEVAIRKKKKFFFCKR